MLGAEELLALLGADIVPDRQFTNGTQTIVMDFQRRNGLAVDGIVDIDTWRVLLALAAEVPNPPAPATVPTTTAAPSATSAPVSAAPAPVSTTGVAVTTTP